MRPEYLILPAAVAAYLGIAWLVHVLADRRRAKAFDEALERREYWAKQRRLTRQRLFHRSLRASITASSAFGWQVRVHWTWDGIDRSRQTHFRRWETAISFADRIVRLETPGTIERLWDLEIHRALSDTSGASVRA